MAALGGLVVAALGQGEEASEAVGEPWVSGYDGFAGELCVGGLRVGDTV